MSQWIELHGALLLAVVDYGPWGSSDVLVLLQVLIHEKEDPDVPHSAVNSSHAVIGIHFSEGSFHALPSALPVSLDVADFSYSGEVLMNMIPFQLGCAFEAPTLSIFSFIDRDFMEVDSELIIKGSRARLSVLGKLRPLGDSIL